MITIVSGLPRSGTSLMMQMLVAGGMSPLSDGERPPDTDNPRGYLEWERVKQLPNDPNCIAEAEGKVVKVISRLLLALPPSGYEYRIVFMQRPLPEVIASQDQMLRRRGTYKEGVNSAVISASFEKHLRDVHTWLDGKPTVQVLWIPYHDVLQDARRVGQKLSDFLKLPLNLEAMVGQVDGSLYRNRSNGTRTYRS
jgi:Sulfotransferase domain